MKFCGEKHKLKNSFLSQTLPLPPLPLEMPPITRTMSYSKAASVHIAVSGIAVVLTFIDGQKNELLTTMIGCFWMLYTGFEEFIGVVKKAETSQPTNELPFGMKRLPVVMEYANGCVLLFFAFSCLIEGLGKLMHHHTPSSSLSLILLQLAVHSSYALLFNKQPTPTLQGKQSIIGFTIRRSLISLLSLLCYLLSHTFLSKYIALDPCFTVVMVCWVVYYLWPLQRVAAEILLQKAPMNVKVMLDKSVKEIEACQGVLEVTDEKYWSIREGDIIAAVKVRVRDDADTQRVLAAARPNFQDLVTDLTVQVEKYEYHPSPPVVEYVPPPTITTATATAAAVDLSVSHISLPPMTPTNINNTMNNSISSPVSFATKIPVAPRPSNAINAFDISTNSGFDVSDMV